ncbi:rna-directed dna polymerase from mobile element jockey- hypothetical protein [Limosa lapponica baueri]|uniref:Reverse transcriptase domain-containing protein n=1 Tax=Limosa lapponica baueri TaxID=1758121 RepID=A0A2I0TVZ4_LIMLA|nr:rna-directed dna polymerase from mobile element jockey- hypothetical protein [Limosa lapponica baueri]
MKTGGGAGRIHLTKWCVSQYRESGENHSSKDEKVGFVRLGSFYTNVLQKGQEEDPGNYRPVNLTSIPEKVMEQVFLDVISKHVEAKKVIGSGQHGFTKGKSCLANLIVCHDGITGWVDEERAVDVVCLDFSKTFDTVSHNILMGKLRKCGLDEWT